MQALHAAYPALAAALPSAGVTELPTPVAPLDAFGLPRLVVKNDGVSGPLFGGNKVRTLDPLLAAAHPAGPNVVFGLPGTSMALASAVYAAQRGIPLRVLLIAQRPTAEAQRNLRLFQHVGAEMVHVTEQPDLPIRPAQLAEMGYLPAGADPFVFNPNSPLGMVGYVNAAFELARQVDAGILPAPDRLYIAMGLFGTATGLLLGLRAAGLPTRLTGVIGHPADLNEARARMAGMFDAAAGFLRTLDPSFPAVAFPQDAVTIHAADPADPGALARAGFAHAGPFRAQLGLPLDATWTAPVAGVLAADAASGTLDGQRVLYWHTLNTRPTPPAADALDYHELPPEFHPYFETDELAEVNMPFWLA